MKKKSPLFLSTKYRQWINLQTKQGRNPHLQTRHTYVQHLQRPRRKSKSYFTKLRSQFNADCTNTHRTEVHTRRTRMSRHCYLPNANKDMHHSVLPFRSNVCIYTSIFHLPLRFINKIYDYIMRCELSRYTKRKVEEARAKTLTAECISFDAMPNGCVYVLFFPRKSN